MKILEHPLGLLDIMALFTLRDE